MYISAHSDDLFEEKQASGGREGKSKEREHRGRVTGKQVCAAAAKGCTHSALTSQNCAFLGGEGTMARGGARRRPHMEA